jgi:hypothetical protein
MPHRGAPSGPRSDPDWRLPVSHTINTSKKTPFYVYCCRGASGALRHCAFHLRIHVFLNKKH